MQIYLSSAFCPTDGVRLSFLLGVFDIFFSGVFEVLRGNGLPGVLDGVLGVISEALRGVLGVFPGVLAPSPADLGFRGE